MRKTIVFALAFIFAPYFLTAQELHWRVALDYFFDNTEYAKSTLTNDKTMTGVYFAPELGLKWDSLHTVYAGAGMLKTAGSANVIDDISPIAYYQYRNRKSTFYAGVFPRNGLLQDYSDFFFQDSINYYRPTLQGFLWKAGSANSMFKLWLDWTGHETATVRETFFIGASGFRKKNIIFGEFQSYLFHFANTHPRNPLFGVTDNALALFSVGLNYSNDRGIDTLLVSAGVLAGYERDRKIANGTYTPIGAVIRLNAEYYCIGTQNTLYAGDRRNYFYDAYNTGLYWNNPFLRAGFYAQSKWYIHVIRNRFVNGKLSMNLHFSEGKVMHEQVFTIKTLLDSSIKPDIRTRPGFIDGWFN